MIRSAPFVRRLSRSRLPARAQGTGAVPPPPPNLNPKSDRQTCLLVGIIVGSVMLALLIGMVAISAAIMFPALSRARGAAYQASCANNLKQMALVFKMFGAENPDGHWPALSEKPGQFSPDMDAIHPEYFTDLTVLRCPNAPQDIEDAVESDGGSYIYLGYAVQTEAEARAFLDAYREALESGQGFEEDLPIPLGHETLDIEAIPRLRERIPYAEQANVPVMFDRSFENHDARGINVLFMDGRVEFIWAHENRFPAVEWYLDELEALREHYTAS